MTSRTIREALCSLWISMMLLLPTSGWSLSSDADHSVFGEWTQLDSHQLLQLGENYLHNPAAADSALACLTVLSERYYSGAQDTASMRCYVHAFYDLMDCYVNRLGNYQQATSSIVLAERIAKEKGFDDLLPRICFAEAALYAISDNALGRPASIDKAIHGYQEAFDYALKVSDPKMLTIIVDNMVQLAVQTERWQDAKSRVEAYLAQDIRPEVEMSQYTRMHCQAVMLTYSGDCEQARALYARMPEYVDMERNVVTCQIQCLRNTAWTYVFEDRWKEAIALYDQIISDPAQSSETLMMAYRDLINIYNKKGDHATAEHYKDLMRRSRDSLLAESDIIDIESMPLMQQLQMANVEASRTQQRHRRIIWWLLICLLGALLLTLGVWLYFRHANRRQRRLYLESIQRLQHDETERQKRRHAPAETACTEDDEHLIARILDVMDTSEEIYQPDFTLKRLAELADSRYWEVSRVLNERLQKNFNTLLSEYRIREACRRMNDPATTGQLTLEAIGESVGFKGRSHFSRLFKQAVGMLPSDYLRQARSQH